MIRFGSFTVGNTGGFVDVITRIRNNHLRLKANQVYNILL